MALAAWQATIVDESGNVQQNAQIEVRREATGALAAIYADRDGSTPLDNPFTVDEGGFARFYAAGGAVKITATQGEFSRTWRHVPIGTLAERDNVPASLIRYDIIAAETSAGVTPTNYSYPPGDIRRYGAVGDDSTDNDEAVSRWLSIGGDLLIPAGTFRASGAPYTVNSNTSIRGLGMGVSVLKNTADATDFFRTHTRTSGVASPAAQKENIHFADFTIDQDHSTKADAGRGIHVSWTNNITCTRVEVINAGGAGIRIDGYGSTFEDGSWLESDALPTDPFTTGTASSTTVTVSHPRHSLNTGALVTFAGVVDAIDGIPAADFNTEHSITVVDRNTYTITTATGASSGSTSGGGSSVTASNPRHATRWGQSTGYAIVDCRTEGCYYDVEIEGGARDGVIRGHRGVNSAHHGIRLPSAFGCKLTENHIKNCGEVAYWIDRSRDIEAIANSAPDCEKHIFALGRVDGFNISHNSGSLDTPGTNHFLTDAFQNPCGVEDGVIAYNRVTTGDSGARIQLVSKSKRVVIAGNVNINLDVAAAGNEDIDVWSNGGRSAVISSIANDQYARRFGGDIHFGPSLQSDDQPSRYTEQPPIVMSFVGTPTNNQFMFRYVFVEERYFTTNFAGSRGSIGTNPTSTLTLSIQKNGVQVGTAVFDTNGNCTFTLASPTTFDPGDVLTVRNQASADATAADICLVLR